MVKRLGRTIVLLGMLNLFFLPETFAIPIVSVLPSSTIVGTGGSVTVDIDVSDVTDLYAFLFDIGFTPGILSATFLSEGGFLPRGGTTAFISGAIDNSTGTISFTADTLLGPVIGVNGSGTLAVLQFVAGAPGTSQVDLSNLILLDSNLLSINANSLGGTATVAGVSAVPEPSSLLLISSGFIVLIMWQIRAYKQSIGSSI